MKTVDKYLLDLIRLGPKPSDLDYLYVRDIKNVLVNDGFAIDKDRGLVLISPKYMEEARVMGNVAVDPTFVVDVSKDTIEPYWVNKDLDKFIDERLMADVEGYHYRNKEDIDSKIIYDFIFREDPINLLGLFSELVLPIVRGDVIGEVEKFPNPLHGSERLFRVNCLEGETYYISDLGNMKFEEGDCIELPVRQNLELPTTERISDFPLIGNMNMIGAEWGRMQRRVMTKVALDSPSPVLNQLEDYLSSDEYAFSKWGDNGTGG